MNTQDIRWIQRLENYTNALRELSHAVETRVARPLSRLEAMGLIQAFEMSYELGWNLLKDYLSYQGISDLVGSRDTIRAAVTQSVLTEADGTVWLDMLQDRNRTSRICDEDTIRAIEQQIAECYLPALTSLQELLSERARRHLARPHRSCRH